MRPVLKDGGRSSVFPLPFKVQELLLSTCALLRVPITLWLVQVRTEEVSNAVDPRFRRASALNVEVETHSRFDSIRVLLFEFCCVRCHYRALSNHAVGVSVSNYR